jgi:23S rRNA (cytidine2498-2'-O)-methyltransferase
MSQAIFVCEAGWEAALAAELRRMRIGEVDEAAVSGLVRLHASFGERIPAIAFARQCLPDATTCEAATISAWSDVVCMRIIERLDADERPWRLHVFQVAASEGKQSGGRAKLIAEKIDETLRQTKRRLAKRRTADANAPWLADETLVQVALTSSTTGFMSLAVAHVRQQWQRIVSRFIGGYIAPAVDKQAPSRAFAKLVEVEQRLNCAIAKGETCVDLGASPGSWTYTAAARGATVTAVDRSPLRDDLMQHSRVRFVRGDAFRYRPETPVDWLLSDVIAYPERVGELLRTWLGARLCRRFCVTIKFHGRDDDAQLEPIKEWLATSGYEHAVRRLDANKNEATAYGILGDATASACLA